MKLLKKPFRYEVFHITFVLLALFLVVFILPNFFPGTPGILAMTTPGVMAGEWWQVFTYIFVHPSGQIFNLLGNMMVFFFFGLALEDQWGSWETGFFYLMITLAVSGTTLGLSILTGEPAILYGANALSYGVMMAWAAYNPNQQIYLMGIIGVKAKWLLMGYMGLFTVLAFFNGGFYSLTNILGALISALYLGIRHGVNVIKAFSSRD